MTDAVDIMVKLQCRPRRSIPVTVERGRHMAKARLLIIDDEKEFIDTIAVRLKALGYDIIEALSGEEGLDKVHKEKPDLIILDLAMPGMDGFEVCERLKVDKDYKAVPIVVLSAKFQPNDIQFAKELGADAYLTKPVDLKMLLTQIESFLRKAPGAAIKKEARR